ncbi:hypothetical protein E3E31_07845 [Thermococcus sp. M39]|uniref:hypothetical protein n=1 Tax=unclassified Thermococcus TaxID=2627626 RepID=UPI00143B28F9|nr:MULTISPECIES: hypothetical protein [unclassified Thermococcus]NJE08435.1 hypothetical protein [Thermococcus sp. M39]NJE11938.1 hypothetical protein [Thermococcus sp. LS2]
MEEVRELKNVLERVEKKLIAASKMYAAMNFAFWLVVMLLYYILINIVEMPGWADGIYWGGAIGVAIWFTGKIWRKFAELVAATGRKASIGTLPGILILASWIVGSTVGWIIIPRTSIAVNEGARLAVGFLTFIGLSVFGQWLVFFKYGEAEKEMIPAFLVPFLGIAIAWNMKSGAMTWAGFVVALGFSVTVLWYLYSAFKTLG